MITVGILCGQYIASIRRRRSTLQPCVIAAESVNQESGTGPEVEAARLALELAQEKSQRQKAENDFEVSFQNANMATVAYHNLTCKMCCSVGISFSAAATRHTAGTAKVIPLVMPGTTL